MNLNSYVRNSAQFIAEERYLFGSADLILSLTSLSRSDFNPLNEHLLKKIEDLQNRFDVNEVYYSSTVLL